MTPPRLITSLFVQVGLLNMIQREDPNGNLMELILELRSTTHANPSCAASMRCQCSLPVLAGAAGALEALQSMSEGCFTVGGHETEAATMEGAEHYFQCAFALMYYWIDSVLVLFCLVTAYYDEQCVIMMAAPEQCTCHDTP